jgi:excisionase family DNA binding protein
MLINMRIHRRILEKKKKLDGYRPLPHSMIARLRNELMIEYNYNSNAMEGNTLTLHETRLAVEEGITVGGKSLKEYLGAKNHPEAIKFVEELTESGRNIDEDSVLHLHKLILNEIDETAGQYRATGVRIAGAGFMPPPSKEVKPQILMLLKWLRDNPEELTPIELAAMFHHRFVQIHPFAEGNGRVARLLMNAILMKHGYPFITNISYGDRKKYLKSLYDADMGNMSNFVNFIARSVERSLDIYLHALEEPKKLSLAEASKYTPYSQEYLSLLARKGAIGAFKLGRNWYITRDELERYVKSIDVKKHKTKGSIL